MSIPSRCAATLCLVLLPSAAWAGEIGISSESATKAISVAARDARLSDILGGLGARFGFEVQGQEAHAGTDSLTGRYEGSLSQILARLLRNHNHLIIRGASSVRIERVVILARTAPAAGPSTVARQPSDARAHLARTDDVPSEAVKLHNLQSWWELADKARQARRR